jgi:NDP-sugar pyrophosphorylase family protein
VSGSASIRHAVILAAGRGNRMRPLTDAVPKAMAPYRDDTLIGNSLKMLNERVKYVHVTVGYKRAMLSHYLMERGVDSLLNTEGHGNAWWIFNTLLHWLEEPLLVLTCDNITTIDIGFLESEYHRLGEPADMIVPVKPIPQVMGDFIEQENGRVTRLQREHPTDLYCSGIQVLHPARVVSMTGNQDGFYDVWNRLMEQRQLGASALYPHPWFSVDTLEQLNHFG